MRKLTVIRKKSIINCLGRIFLYVSCTKEESEIYFDGIPYKQIGIMKNGEMQEFEIDDEEKIFFLSFSKTMPEEYNATYKIEKGTEDITLLASPHYNPFKGNPFTVDKL